ncbi:MAG: hypothetical protein ABSB89_01825 [Candidatus Bathyarchaeia archaeon]|jgi:hypothetical protein
MVDDERKDKRMEPENIKEILSVVSSEVPALIKSILASVFSEEAGRSMGKAAAAYYKELKNGGMPEQVAVKMTEDYMRTFTSIGDMLRSGGMGRHGERHGEDIGGEIEKRVRERLDERLNRDTDKEREGEEEQKE